MFKRFHIVICLLCVCQCLSTYADNDALSANRQQNDSVENRITSDSTKQVKKKKQNKLFRTLGKILEIDTNYIERNKYNVTLMSQADWRYKLIWLRGGDSEGKDQTLYFNPHSQVTIGPYVSYSMLAFGWTVDIGSKLSTNNSNLYLSLYAPMVGIDYYYENDINGYRFNKLSGFSDEIKDQCEGLGFPGLSSDMTYIHAYYIFNHRKFSYPAAYSQSTIQRRSSGALMLGYSYSRQLINFDYEQLPPPFHGENGEILINEALKVKEVRYINHSFSVGYAYNWVFARNFLFNVTALPSIGYNFTKGEKLTSDKLYKLHNLNFDFVGKLAVVWNTNHLFAGGSFTAHTYAYKKSTFSCQNALLSAQLYMGIYLWRKKEK